MLVPHILRKMIEHSYRFAGLEEKTVPSAAVTDQDTARWSEERYARDLELETKQKAAGE